MLIAFFILILLVSAVMLGGYLFSGPRYKGPVSDHFDGKKFLNPGNVPTKNIGDVLKWILNRHRATWVAPKVFNIGEKPAERIDLGTRVTFVNHSTFLIQTKGLNILTDPVWYDRASPLSWAGPKRKRPPGIERNELPKIDLILLSHNHWDHLDIGTIKTIWERDHCKIATPLGLGEFLRQNGVENWFDFDWWDEREIVPGFSIQAVPAQHGSGRGMFDQMATLWTGYVIKKTGGNIYFAGDTGYNDKTFKEIGQRCAPLAISIIPIGAYKPAWFMKPIHCSPFDAVQLHRDIKTEVSIACHFGTFQLADEGRDDPMKDLHKAKATMGERPDSFTVPEEGKAIIF